MMFLGVQGMNDYEDNGCNNNFYDLDLLKEEENVRKQVFCGCNHVGGVAWKCEVEIGSVSFGHDNGMINSS